jgi:signal transduction histidine kinase
MLAVLAAIVFSRPITIPLAKLTAATRLLTRGDYSVQVPTKAPGELGELSRNFNEMAAQLKRDVEELQQQEIWRRELIMNITHDLATPLTAIAGLGEALIDGVNHTHEDYEATGRVIVRETLRLHRLVRDLHVMAKLEAEAIQPKKKSIRLAALVDEVLAVLTAEFERFGVEPVNSISYGLTPVQADADLLTRVFSNLCSNSLHHTPPGGYFIIEALEYNGWLVISITDTGEGIPVEALSRVFERFYRVDSSRQSSTGGSGLGLAIVRAIIEAHDGTVWVENVPGAGARISFTLPLYVGAQDSLPDTLTFPLIKRSINASQRKKKQISLKDL